MGNNYSIIENKLVQFTKKYYLNNVLKGVIFSIAVLVLSGLSVLFIEYFGYLSPNQKLILIVGFILVNLLTLAFYVLLPGLGYLGVRVKLNKKKANEIIITYFPEIKDKLWNLIELREIGNNGSVSEELVIASIDQKIDELKRFDFSKSIHFKDNLRFVYLLCGIVGLTAIVFLVSPGVVKDSSERLLNYSETYIKPSPFSFEVLNTDMKVGKGEDFQVIMKVNSEKDFENTFIKFGGNTYLMSNDSVNIYSYQFKNINNSINIQFEVQEYVSNEYRINVLPKPLLTGFGVTVNKPRYTNLKSEKFENITELVLPIGAACDFEFNTYETDTLLIKIGDKIVKLSDEFKWNRRFENSTDLKISLVNSNYTEEDYLNISIETIPDDYPSIVLGQLVDSVDYTRVYFKGQIEDDYGFSSLKMITKIQDKVDSALNIQILPGLLQQDFFYAFDFNYYKGLSDQIDYYFEVTDNDAVNGNKSSVSEYFTFRFPDINDVFDYQEEQFENIEEILSNSMDLTRQLKDDMVELKEKLLNSELSDWERKEVMKNIYSKKESLEKALKDIHEKNDELNNYMESFTEQNEDLVAKQEEIQNILEEVMSDELKEMMDQFQEMMEQFNQNKMNELSEEMDISLDDLSKQLDRNLEMLKRMKIEKQLDLITSDMDEHIKKQEELAERIENGENPEDLVEEQQKEKEALSELQEQYKNVKDINQELSEPLNLYDFDKEFDDIQKEFDNSLEQQEKNNKKKSKNSMEQNKSNMENLAFMMQQMKDAAFAEQASENLADILQILDNTVTFSFEQEKLISPSGQSTFNSHEMTQQKKLYQDFQVIKDSLYSLARRQPAINITVNKEIVSIESNFRKVDKELRENRTSKARINQMGVLTSTNNLSLFLSEVIKQMQQQMANSQPGNQNCEKPGNNPNPNSMGNSMQSMQQSLQQQLEKMMQMMKDGQQGGQMNGEMGKALSQQEKMQNMLQKMMNQGNVGSDSYETLKQAEALLNKVREDIIRNNLSNQTLRRNKEILTRLLEAENAENEREIDDKRKSQTADQNRISEVAKQFDNNDSNNNFKEKLVKQKLVLKKYYQKKYQNYVNQLDSINGSTY